MAADMLTGEWIGPEFERACLDAIDHTGSLINTLECYCCLCPHMLCLLGMGAGRESTVQARATEWPSHRCTQLAAVEFGRAKSTLVLSGTCCSLRVLSQI